MKNYLINTMDYVNLNGIYRHWKDMHFEKIYDKVMEINKDRSEMRSDILKVIDGYESNITLLLITQFKIPFVMQLEKDILERINQKQ